MRSGSGQGGNASRPGQQKFKVKGVIVRCDELLLWSSCGSTSVQQQAAKQCSSRSPVTPGRAQQLTGLSCAEQPRATALMRDDTTAVQTIIVGPSMRKVKMQNGHTTAAGCSVIVLAYHLGPLRWYAIPSDSGMPYHLSQICTVHP